MATRKGLEPSTSSVTGWHSNRLNYRAIYEIGGNNRARTCDPLLVRQMLSQLSYAPSFAASLSILTERTVFVKKKVFYSFFCHTPCGDDSYYTGSNHICQPFFDFSSRFFEKGAMPPFHQFLRAV